MRGVVVTSEGVSEVDADATSAVQPAPGQRSLSLTAVARNGPSGRGGARTPRQDSSGVVAWAREETVVSQLRCVRGISQEVARQLAGKHAHMNSFLQAMLSASDPVLLGRRSLCG